MNRKLTLPLILTVVGFATVFCFQKVYSDVGSMNETAEDLLVEESSPNPEPVVLLPPDSANLLVATELKRWDDSYRLLSRARVRRTTEYVKVEFSSALESDSHFFLGMVTLKQLDVEKQIPVAVDRLSKKIFVLTSTQWKPCGLVSLDMLYSGM